MLFHSLGTEKNLSRSRLFRILYQKLKTLERVLVRKCQRNESKGEECYQMLTNLIKRINWENVGLPICVSDERPSLHHDHDLHYKSSEIRRTSWRAGQLWGNITTASRSHLCQIDTRINCIVQSR